MANTIVSELEVGVEELWQLLEDVASAHDPVIEGVIQDSTAGAGLDFTVDEEDIIQTALGIKDDESGKLVGYASATIDDLSKHAVVDCLVIHPLYSREGIGKDLSNEGLKFLGMQGVKSVSFQPFGQIELLAPYLMARHGFVYDELNAEYITKSLPSPSVPKPRAKPELPPALAQSAEQESSGRKLKTEEMSVLSDRISELVTECAQYACLNSLNVYSYDDFELESAGRLYVVRHSRPSEDIDESTWAVTERGTAELVTSQYGIVMVTERTYAVHQNRSATLPSGSTYSDLREIRGNDGKMRPLNLREIQTSHAPEAAITLPRYTRIMAVLNRLTPNNLATHYY